jgi:hypothetical protein
MLAGEPFQVARDRDRLLEEREVGCALQDDPANAGGDLHSAKSELGWSRSC